MRQIVFWQNTTSIHQSALIRNIADHAEYKVTLVAEKGISRERLRIGWSNPDFGKAEVLVEPDRETDTIQDWARCPSKMFMYIPFQKPIVTCPIGEAYQLLGKNGLYYECGNISMMTEKLDQALALTSAWKPCQDYVDHSWETRALDFLNWLNENWDLR